MIIDIVLNFTLSSRRAKRSVGSPRRVIVDLKLFALRAAPARAVRHTVWR